ncbi:MAG: KpsF/GutQ family sugar-phosphate isomerase [bacterium]|nr:MAG: KpsF/GutQ family sugar-phosphate isomerase [bacterium]
MDHDKVLESARRVLRIEEESIEALRSRLGEEFALAVDLLKSCRGRVVFAGMGKSGLVCRKIAATFASTGTPSLFLHPAEGGHGDLGMLAKGDVLVAVSNSGETQELIRLLPAVKRLGIPIISMTGGASSTLAARADVVLDISVTEEACPLNLAPTASTTVTMALGDALAVALLEARGFTENDFAFFHPVGALGRRLLTVSEIMHVGKEIPCVRKETTMREALFEITSKQLGFTTVQDDGGRLLGIITDGDLRRSLEGGSDPLSLTAGQVMTPTPKVINAEALAAKALQIMESSKITSLVVVDDDKQVTGVVHMHDILKAGIA